MSKLLKQEFKTLSGAQKRAAFERAHCDGKYAYDIVRFIEDERDLKALNVLRWSEYTWRLERRTL
jgi:hypothetical protein